MPLDTSKIFDFVGAYRTLKNIITKPKKRQKYADHLTAIKNWKMNRYEALSFVFLVMTELSVVMWMFSFLPTFDASFGVRLLIMNTSLVGIFGTSILSVITMSLGFKERRKNNG